MKIAGLLLLTVLVVGCGKAKDYFRPGAYTYVQLALADGSIYCSLGDDMWFPARKDNGEYGIRLELEAGSTITCFTEDAAQAKPGIVYGILPPAGYLPIPEQLRSERY